MTPDFLRSPTFTPWRDPASGVVSHILAAGPGHPARVAPHQQTFYYTSPSLSDDLSRYWFYCAHPPAAGHSLGSVDLNTGRARHHPETAFASTFPLLDRETGDTYWANQYGIWMSPAGDTIRARLVNRFTPEQTRNRTVHRYATHLTLTADRKALFVDAIVGADCVLGIAPLDGSPIEIWHSQPAPPHFNHGLASPADPTCMLVASDYHTAPQTGKVTPYDNRLWLLRRGAGAPVPVYPTSAQAGPDREIVTHNPHFARELSLRTITDPRAMHGHEWWSADGRHIYYIHYQTGIERVPLSTAGTPEARPELVWPHATVSHAHVGEDENLLVLDALPPDEPDAHHVRFVNLRTGRSLDIVSSFPALSDPELKRYHVHPHPQFCGGGRYICYTTTVHDRIDVAFLRVSDLVSATS